jgi:hypothetical protein
MAAESANVIGDTHGISSVIPHELQRKDLAREEPAADKSLEKRNEKRDDHCVAPPSYLPVVQVLGFAMLFLFLLPWYLLAAQVNKVRQKAKEHLRCSGNSQ